MMVDCCIQRHQSLKLVALYDTLKKDCVEIGNLICVDISDLSQPPSFKILFKDGRIITTTSEFLELKETPDPFSISTRAKNIIEVASTIPQ